LRDVITDFIALGVPADDTIRLSAIDARPGGVDNAFKFIGSHKFHHRDGELRFKIDVAHDSTIVQGDVNGDGRADLEIELTGKWVLHATDFIL
jgi:hypothetical protein